MERDDKTTLKGVAGKDFNSHAHVERDSFSYIIQIRKKNFNSHAHVERDVLNLGLTNAQNISTHTLTWSVTNNFQ